jgi:hypothetical protein
MSAGRAGSSEPEEKIVEEEAVETENEEIPTVVPESTAEGKRPPPGLTLGDRVRLQQEATAQWLAFLVMGIFGLIVLNIVACGFGSALIAYLVGVFKEVDGLQAPAFDALETAKVILPYLATPLGVAMGYYFTKRATEQKK